MRFYSIKISKPDGGRVWIPPSMKGLGLRDASYASHSGSRFFTSALDVHMDIPMSGAHDAKQGAQVIIMGVGITDIAQSADIHGYAIEIRAGMRKGLPLAVPKKPELLVVGQIIRCSGNWEGVNTSLHLIIDPSDDPVQEDPNKPRGQLVLNWQDGQPMSEAIQDMLANAYPNDDLEIAISDKLKVKGQRAGYYGDLKQAALAIKQFTQGVQFRGITRTDGSAYDGVTIVREGGTIRVYDGTQKSFRASEDKPVQIDFIDLIGQPTWIEENVISFKTVLRGDLHIGDYIKLPKSLRMPYVLTPPQASGDPTAKSPSRNNLIFQGAFPVHSIHHFAQYRQGGAGDWATQFECALPEEAPETQTTGPTPAGSIKKEPLPAPPMAPTPADQPFA
jgi:hypothetical protein